MRHASSSFPAPFPSSCSSPALRASSSFDGFSCLALPALLSSFCLVGCCCCGCFLLLVLLPHPLYPYLCSCAVFVQISDKVSMGVFEPINVHPFSRGADIDMSDRHNSNNSSMSGGVEGPMPFSHLEPRSVVIHGSAFSPDNAQIAVTESPRILYHSFYLIATYRDRMVCSFHVIPSSATSSQIRSAVTQSDTLQEVLFHLDELCPDVAEHFHQLLSPFL